MLASAESAYEYIDTMKELYTAINIILYHIQIYFLILLSSFVPSFSAAQEFASKNIIEASAITSWRWIDERQQTLTRARLLSGTCLSASVSYKLLTLSSPLRCS